MDLTKVLHGYESYPKPPIDLQYGTSGFRTKATLLDHVAFRIGILAVLRSRATGQVIGVMITASHNPEDDNGVKVIDPNGRMLSISWETRATDLVNCNKTDVEDKIKAIISSDNIHNSYEGQVLLGWDSRPSSERLVQITSEGIESIGGSAIKTNMCPTPVLHYLVTCKNNASYGIANVEFYYRKLITAFNNLWNEVPTGNYEKEIYFDGANGVGALSMSIAKEKLKDKIDIQIFNDALNVFGKLNNRCGADFVKTQQTPPDNILNKPNLKCVSFDGDADRILYYYVTENGKLHLMDGDHIAVLIATFLKELLEDTELQASLGIIQTAYANGNSTKYIKEKLKLDPPCVKTGVKYLHEKAIMYDIGIYFEANGHGTVVFSDKLKASLENEIKMTSGKRLEALNKFRTFIDLVNETIGDAFSDFLIIETILHSKGWSLKNWTELYSDLPSRLSKVNVKDRNVIQTTDAERKVKEPSNLQTQIDELVLKFKSGRSFVRPSGTEDIVRVYAEAETPSAAEELCKLVSQLVYDVADGIGTRP